MSIPREKFSKLLTDWLNDQLGAISNGFGFLQLPRILNEDKPFGVVYSIPGGGFDLTGPYEAYAAGSLLYQISSSSKKSARHAEFLADRVRSLMLSLPNGYPAVPAPPGWKVVGVDPPGGAGGVTTSDDNLMVPNPNRVFTVPEDFMLWVAPTEEV